MTTYKIRRFYRDPSIASHDVKGLNGLTLEEAKAHCRDPRTRKVGRDGVADWFDGFTAEDE